MFSSEAESLPGSRPVDFEHVYQELRAIARRFLNGERAGHTLTPTALVHEAWMRVGKNSELSEVDGRRHVRAIVATVMRQILVEHARRRQRRIQILQSGAGPIYRLADDNEGRQMETGGVDPIDLLDLDQALQRFSQDFPEKARLVELKFFGGLTLSECAIELGICERTADRYWHFARAWLNQMLESGEA